MVETLTNLKNNKMSKRPAAAQSQDGGSVERMKKFLSGLNKNRHGENYQHLIALLILTEGGSDVA